MTAEMVLFGIFSFFLVLTALGVVFSRSPVYAAMNLVAAFFFMAGIYVLLTAHLIAFMQVLVYAGAVMVLFLFVIMLISLGDEHLFPSRKTTMHVIGTLGALCLFSVIAVAIYRTAGTAAPFREVGATFGTVKAVGQVLFTEFLLPFEAT